MRNLKSIAVALSLAIAAPAIAAPKSSRALSPSALLACEQSVTDECIDRAKPDGSTDCMLEALQPEVARCMRTSSPDLKTAKAKASAAKLELARAKAAAKLAAHRVKLLQARDRAAKAAAKLKHEQAIEDCVYERTGPTGGIPVDEALAICVAEVE